MRTDRLRSLGSWSGWTSTIFLPCRVMRTCTSPYSVLTTGPSTVREAAVVVGAAGAPAGRVVEGAAGPDEDVALVVLDAPGASAVASEAPPGLVWKFASNANVPAVAAMTGTARRIGAPSNRIARSERGGWGHPELGDGGALPRASPAARRRTRRGGGWRGGGRGGGGGRTGASGRL